MGEHDQIESSIPVDCERSSVESTNLIAILRQYKSLDTRFNERSVELRTSVAVFMEDNLSLTTTASAFFFKGGGFVSVTRNLAMSIGLKYYFLRGMQ
jgi:hypothetical protein